MTKSYVRVTKGLKDKGIIVQEKDVKKHIDSQTNCFQSLYYYPEEALTYFKENGNSIKGYKGGVQTPFIVFDVDSEDLEVSRKNTIRLINKLRELGFYKELGAKVSFSGSKGYHLYVKTDYQFKPKELKTFCLEIARKTEFINEAGFKIDPSVYNVNRVMRIVNTKNEKSGLYKVDLAEQDLVNYKTEEIQKYAEKPQMKLGFEETIKAKGIKDLIEEVQARQIKEKNTKQPIKPSQNNCKIQNYPCYQAIQDGEILQGESNALLLRLAQFYKDCGHSEDQCISQLLKAGENRVKKHPKTNEIDEEKIRDEIISCIYDGQGYTFGLSDEYLRQKCNDGMCYLHKPPKSGKRPPYTPKKTNLFSLTNKGFAGRIVKDNNKGEKMAAPTGFKSLSQTNQEFEDQIEELLSMRLLTGITELDKLATIVPLGLTVINAKASVGKTTILFRILNQASKNGVKTLFYCADMSEFELFTKLKSYVLKKSPDDIYFLHKQNDPASQELKRQAFQFIQEDFNNLEISYIDNRLTPRKIEQDIEAYQKSGVEVGAVAIDYLQKMDKCSISDSSQLSDTLFALKHIVHKRKINVIALSQIARTTGGNETTPIHTAACGMGGSVIEQVGSVIINLWRPMMHYQNGTNDHYLGYCIAKNRMGKTASGVLHFNGAHSFIRTLTPEEYAEYKELEAEKGEQDKEDRKRGKFR